MTNPMPLKFEKPSKITPDSSVPSEILIDLDNSMKYSKTDPDLDQTGRSLKYEGYKKNYTELDNYPHSDISKKKRMESIFTNIKVLKPRRTRLLNYILSRTDSKLMQARFLMINLFAPHLMVLVALALKIVMQHYVNTTCWLVCLCDDSYFYKSYFVINEYLTYWVTLILCMENAAVFVFFNKNLKFTLVYHLVTFLYIFLYSVLTAEGERNSLSIYFVIISFTFLYPIPLYLKKGGKFKDFLKRHFLSSSLIYTLFTNHLLKLVIFNYLDQYLIDSFEKETARNLKNLYTFFYIEAFRYLTRIGLIAYKEICSSINKHCHEPIIFSSQIILCYYMCIIVGSILKTNSSDWASWLLLISYLFFIYSVFSGQSVFDLLMIALKKTKKKSENDSKDFNMMFGGCLLDIQISFAIKVVMWIFVKKWLITSESPIYYSSCNLDISDKFEISYFSMISIFILNFTIPIILIICTLRRKIIFFEIKRNRNIIIHIIYLFLLYNFIDGPIQMFY